MKQTVWAEADMMWRMWTHSLGTAAIVLSLVTSNAAAEQPDRVYTETFDGSDPAIMLNGVVNYGVEGPWAVRVDDGVLELSNFEAGDALRYYTIPTVSYPGTGRVSRTDGATIEVDVRVEAHSRSGAGLVGGFDSRGKDYLLFAIGSERQVYVVSRVDGKTQMLVTTENDTVREGQTNRLRVSREVGGLGFDVNGTRIMTIERAEIPGQGIGIGAFGRGTFSFDNVQIVDTGFAPRADRPPVRPAPPPVRSGAANCSLPAPSDEARIVMFGTYEGEALSSVALAGPYQETTATHFRIEEGPEPLYVIVSSYSSMLSVFSGATERVERLILLSNVAGEDRSVGVAVAGIDDERTTFATGRHCWPSFHEAESVGAISARAVIGRQLGRQPDAIFGAYEATRVSLPSGNVEKSRPGSTPAPKGFDANIWRDGSRFYPAGLVQVPTEQIVSPAKAVPYDILPSQFGIAQLVGSGSIEKMADGAFRIVEPIAHYPASLGGAHAVTFVLAPGVPRPEGDPGHSCVLAEETGMMIGLSPLCRPR